MATSRYVQVDRISAFIARTVSHGVPRRIAILRAARKFSVDRALVQSFDAGGH